MLLKVSGRSQLVSLRPLCSASIGADTNTNTLDALLESISIMNDRISKAQPGRSCVRRSKRLQEQEQLLNAIAAPSPAAAGLPRDAPAGPSKSQVDEIDQSPAKRNAPLTDAQQPEVEGEGADEVNDMIRLLLWDQLLMMA